MHPALSNEEYTVGWVCALPLELTAACAVLDVVHADPIVTTHRSRDGNVYYRGSIGHHNVVITCLPKGMYANVSAAIVARDMYASFNRLAFCFMVGIGGGIPDTQTGYNSIRLGDVVVGTPELDLPGVVKIDTGKKEANNYMRRTGSLNKPSLILLKHISGLQASSNFSEDSVQKWIDRVFTKHPRLRREYGKPDVATDTLYKLEYDHIGEPGTSCVNCDKGNTLIRVARDSPSPVIHYGTIATGDSVIKSATEREAIRTRYGAKCVEMEAAGVLDAMEGGCLVVRGICDYSDTHKNKGWQGYAALTAAAYTKELLQRVPPQRVTINGLDGAQGISSGGTRSQDFPPTPLQTPPYSGARYSVAAIQSDEIGDRVWFQGDTGLFEVTFNDNLKKWKSYKLEFTDVAWYTPLAAVVRGREIRLFYVTQQGSVNERHWTEGEGWSIGPLSKQNVRVASNSKLAAVGWPGSIRLFYQESGGNKIQEYCFDDSTGQWTKGKTSLPAALSGSSLTAACYILGTGPIIHIFYQDKRLYIKEMVYEGGNVNSEYLEQEPAAAHTPISACALLLHDAEVAVFWKSSEGIMSEWSRPSKQTKRIEKSSFKGDGIAMVAVASGSVVTFSRTLFVLKDGRIVEEERWFADGDEWGEPAPVVPA